MNYLIQEKRIKPNAKSCNWCKKFSYDNNNFGCQIDFINNMQDLTPRQIKKVLNDGFEYCKYHRYSISNFRKWKVERNENKKIWWEE